MGVRRIPGRIAAEHKCVVQMTPSFHDGFLDGVMLLDPKTVHLYLRTVGGGRYVFVGRGVEHLRVSNFLEGNIVLDIEVLASEQITQFYIERLYELSPVDADGQMTKLLEMVKRRSLRMVVVSPSYGADCYLLVDDWWIEELNS